MKPEATEDILELLQGYIASATARVYRLSCCPRCYGTGPLLAAGRATYVGFRCCRVAEYLPFVPHKDNLPWNIDWLMLEARK